MQRGHQWEPGALCSVIFPECTLKSRTLGSWGDFPFLSSPYDWILLNHPVRGLSVYTGISNASGYIKVRSIRSPEILQRNSYLFKHVCLFQMRRIHIDRSKVMLLSCIFLFIVHNFTYLQCLLWKIIGTISLEPMHTYLCYNISYLWLNLWRVCSVLYYFVLSTWSGVRGGSDIQPKWGWLFPLIHTMHIEKVWKNKSKAVWRWEQIEKPSCK